MQASASDGLGGLTERERSAVDSQAAAALDVAKRTGLVPSTWGAKDSRSGAAGIEDGIGGVWTGISFALHLWIAPLGSFTCMTALGAPVTFEHRCPGHSPPTPSNPVCHARPLDLLILRNIGSTFVCTAALIKHCLLRPREHDIASHDGAIWTASRYLVTHSCFNENALEVLQLAFIEQRSAYSGSEDTLRLVPLTEVASLPTVHTLNRSTGRVPSGTPSLK